MSQNNNSITKNSVGSMYNFSKKLIKRTRICGLGVILTFCLAWEHNLIKFSSPYNTSAYAYIENSL